jgi:hypothetical protein
MFAVALTLLIQVVATLHQIHHPIFFKGVVIVMLRAIQKLVVRRTQSYLAVLPQLLLQLLLNFPQQLLLQLLLKLLLPLQLKLLPQLLLQLLL